ncbi:hypothetical protein FOZ61_002278, partial [Perkinsus olseni]
PLKPEEVLAMVEDVDYYADAESMVKMVEETNKNGMDFAVRCMAAGIKVDAPGKQSNPAIEEIRDFVLKANVDFGLYQQIAKDPKNGYSDAATKASTRKVTEAASGATDAGDAKATTPQVDTS